MPDEFDQLLRRSAEGSEEARQELLRLYGPHLRRVIRRRLERDQQAVFDSHDFIADLWPSVFASEQLRQAGGRPETVIEVLAEAVCTRVLQAFRSKSPGGGHGAAGTLEVLLVEDDEAVRRMLGLALRAHGFGLTLAAGGEEAVGLYRRLRGAIDLVLMDVQMPGMDGPQTMAALRQIDPEVRCCFMSGHTGRYTADELLRQGAAAVIAKPFASLDELAAALWRAAASR